MYVSHWRVGCSEILRQVQWLKWLVNQKTKKVAPPQKKCILQSYHIDSEDLEYSETVVWNNKSYENNRISKSLKWKKGLVSQTILLDIHYWIL